MSTAAAPLRRGPPLLAAAVLLPLLSAGCANSRAAAVAATITAGSPGAFACRGDERPMVVAELFFGRSLPGGGEVDEAAWRAFVREVLTPAFPDGLTVIDASGQWLDPRTGRTVEAEPTKLVLLAAEEAGGSGEKLDAVRNAYRQRFRQQSVGLIRRPACGAF